MPPAPSPDVGKKLDALGRSNLETSLRVVAAVADAASF
jgi:hypothetical protein